MKGGQTKNLRDNSRYRTPNYHNSSGTRSCHLPNQDYHLHQDQHITKSQLLDNDFDHSIQARISNMKAAKVVNTLFIVASLLLAMYLYIVVNPEPTNATLASSPISPSRNDCLDRFRSSNCTLGQTSPTCRELYSCISNPDAGVPSAVPKTVASKIQQVEEFLENCLLILGGMGFTGALTTLLLRCHFIARKVKRLGGAVLEGLKTPKKEPSPPPFEDQRLQKVGEEVEVQNIDSE